MNDGGPLSWSDPEASSLLAEHFGAHRAPPSRERPPADAAADRTDESAKPASGGGEPPADHGTEGEPVAQ